MSPYLGFRIDKNFWRELKEAAAQKGTSLSMEVRYRLNKYSELLEEISVYKKAFQNSSTDNYQDPKNSPTFQIVVQNNMLLRKIAMWRDSQILMQVDRDMDNRFGTNRYKIWDD